MKPIENKIEIDVIKSSGKRAKFSIKKLSNSLKRSGANEKTIQQILGKVRDELYQGISTKEIYNRAFALLKKEKSVFASKLGAGSNAIVVRAHDVCEALVNFRGA